MFPDKDFASAMETTEKAVTNAANTLVVFQLVITIVLALSLKSMWNLMNVIQVLAYVRFFTGWPAFMLKIFEYMDNAITLKPVSDFLFEYGQTQFDKANATLTDEDMMGMGVQDSDIGKSLGLFSVILAALVFFLIMYSAIKCIKKKTGLAHRLRLILEKKLFYSSFLRYLIVSNLKLNYTIWAFLVATGNFTSFKDGVLTTLLMCMLLILLLFPLFIMVFMVKYQRVLN